MSPQVQQPSGKGAVCCFGELLLRLSPAPAGAWIRDHQMDVYIGGAELNAATALANWRVPVKYATALPGHYLADEVIDNLGQRGIDTSAIFRSGSRIGTYILPQGTDLKGAGVIYDRAHSSFWELTPGMIDWDSVLSGCGWFHFSAISPALNQQVARVCLEGVAAARARGLTVSVDLNYRARLWQYGKNPTEVMPELVASCQVVMGNLWAAESLLGIPSPVATSKGHSKEALINAAAQSMDLLSNKFPGVRDIAYTFRLESNYFAVLRQPDGLTLSDELDLGEVVDKAGSGDCFMGGLIYGITAGNSPKDIVDFAAAAAVGKMKEKGDHSNQTVTMVRNNLEQAWTKNS